MVEINKQRSELLYLKYSMCNMKIKPSLQLAELLINRYSGLSLQLQSNQKPVHVPGQQSTSKRHVTLMSSKHELTMVM